MLIGRIGAAVAACRAAASKVASPARTSPRSAVHSSPDDQHAFLLLIAEYQSVREEARIALTNQQQTLQWSIAAFATIFAGGLVLLASEGISATRGASGFVFLAVFGAGLPTLVLGSCWLWVGEVIRMERASRYLRGLEQHLAVTMNPPPAARLRWETHIAMGAVVHAGGLSRGKQPVTYVGALTIYLGALATSELILFVAAVQNPEQTIWMYLLYAVSAAVVVVYLASLMWLLRDLVRAGSEAVPIASIDPAIVSYPLPKTTVRLHSPSSRRTHGGQASSQNALDEALAYGRTHEGGR